jgi:DNA polymerase-3 subunit beta
MQFTVQKANLAAAMDVAFRAIPSKTTTPLLYNFLIEVDGTDGIITSTDMSTSIKTHFVCMATEPGKMCVDAKMLMQAVKKMGKADISLQTDEQKVIVTGAKARYEFPIRSDVDEYPDMPVIADANKITVDANQFKEMIDGVAFSVGQNISQKIYTAINLSVKDKLLRLTSTDMTRVSIRQKDINYEDDFNVNVPCKTMTELAKSLDGGDLTIESSNINIRFTFGQTTICARLIDGKFFDVDQMFKTKPTINVKCDKRDLMESIDRSLVVVGQEKTPIVFDVKDDYVKMSIKTNVSNFDEDVTCEKTGDDIRIGLNPNFALDALKVTDATDVKIAMHNANSPLFILDEVADEYAYIILPVNI